MHPHLPLLMRQIGCLELMLLLLLMRQVGTLELLLSNYRLLTVHVTLLLVCLLRDTWLGHGTNGALSLLLSTVVGFYFLLLGQK